MAKDLNDISTKRKEHLDALPIWKRCRDVVAGEDAIKKAKEEYLPKLEGDDESEYKKYLQRALFFNASSRTIQAISGSILRKKTLTDPPSEYVEGEVQELLEEILEVGRRGVLVDVPIDGGEPYFVQYKPEQIINWRSEFIDGKEILTLVVLQEEYSKQSSENKYALETHTRFRELVLENLTTNKPTYIQRIFVENTSVDKKDQSYIQDGPDIIPTVKGASMTEIPFLFFGAVSLLSDIDKPPLLDLFSVNLSHYRSSADLEHGRHFTALPTAWVAGFPSESNLKIGSGTAWVTSEVGATAGFLEFTGQGLGALKDALTDKKEMMAFLGAKLLESSRSGVEAAETVRMRQSADGASASSMANLMSTGLSICYQWYLDFKSGTGKKKASVTVNSDVIDQRMTFDEAVKLMSIWQQDGMSTDTYLWNLKQGELIPDNTSIEDEASKIALGNGQNDNKEPV